MTELKETPKFKRRTGRFSEIVRASAQTSTASFSSNRLTRRSVRQKKGFTELIVPSRSKVKGAPLNDSQLQPQIIDNFCTYLERYALGIEGIFGNECTDDDGRNIATLLNQDPKTIDFQGVVEPPELVAAALSNYLEKHRRPMIPAGKHYNEFVEANGELDNTDRIAALRTAVMNLPSSNRAICGRLMRLFYAISENAEFTGRDAAALGGLFGDTLLHNKSNDEQASGADVISFLIENYYPIVFQGQYAAEQLEKKQYDFDCALTELDWKLLLTNAKLYKYKSGQEVMIEGQPNTRLFRVRKGTFRVTKRDKHVATLEPLSLFGEISFLGSYVAEATVAAAEADAELWILDLKFVQQMFGMEPELSMKFYHFIGSYLAKRLLHLSSGASGPYVSKTEHFSSGSESRAPRAGQITPITEELVIKDYPCKYEKDGTLYIMQHYLSHFAPLFGRERKKIIPFDHVSSLSMHDNLREIHIVRKQKNKVSKLEFLNTQDCDEAFALIETMLLNRRRDGPYPPTEHQSRAVALYDFNGEHEHDLSFKINDVIVVLQKREDGWWLGERRGKMGYFPATYVRDDEGLPTLQDWNIVWLGANTLDYKKGEHVLKEQQRVKGLYQVLKGTCEVKQNGKTINKLGKEETFGEISYLGRSVSPDSVVASGKLTVREIPVSWLDKLFENSPALASRVYKYLAVVLEMKLRTLLEPPLTKAELKAAAKRAEKAAKAAKKASKKKKSESSSEGDPDKDNDDSDDEEEQEEHEEEEEEEAVEEKVVKKEKKEKKSKKGKKK